MKYRSKLYFFFVIITLISTSLSVGLLYTEARRLFSKELRNKAVSIASTAAVMLDGDVLKSIDENKDENSPQYISFVHELRKIRDANRDYSTYVKYVYTIMPDPKNPGMLVFGVDAEENPADKSHIGDPDISDTNSPTIDNLSDPYAPNTFIQDKWGLWESGFAPIYDSSGNYVATLGVDIPASLVLFKLNLFLEYGAWALLASLILALIVSHFLSRNITQSLDYLCERAHAIGTGDLVTETHVNSKDEFEVLANSFNEMTRGLQERERLKLSFARYVSAHILEKILESKAPLKLEGERRKVTILFSDLRHFTRLSEELSPEVVVSYLNDYFGKMIEVIFKNHGTLDKLIGDGIMVEFGAPLVDTEQETHAIQTAIEMQEALCELCKKWQKEGKPTIEMGIGVHTGQAVVGNIGSEARMDYTAIGDTVNTASRLEQATKVFKTPIIVSEATYKATGEKYSATHLGPVSLPGKKEQINVYAITGKPLK